MKHFLLLNTKVLSYLIAALITIGGTGEMLADGSKDLFTPTTSGYRQYLNVTNTLANYNPFPNNGVHKVYVNAGEVIYTGSSVVGLTLSGYGTGSVTIYSPTGVQVAYSNTSTGRIDNRTQELNGPVRPGSTGSNYYTPLSYVATVSGIYEIQFSAFGPVSGNNGTNIPDGPTGNTDLYRPLANASSWTQPVHANSHGLILAWDISVGTSTTNGTLIPGRVYSTCLNLIGPNNRFEQSSFYGKVYVLTPEGFSYLVDNNGMNGASFNFFSNNKGIVSTSGDFTSPPIYKSAITTTFVGELEDLIWDPRDADGSGNVTNKIFYVLPRLDLPASANVHIGGTNTTTWLRQTPTVPTASNGFVDCDNNISFTSNVPGIYTIYIDADDNGNYEDPVDVRLTGEVSSGINMVAWDGKDAAGNSIGANSVAILVRLTLAELHFPFLDVETNLNGIIIKRIDPETHLPLDDYDIVFWDDSNISHDNSQATAGASNPNVTGVDGVSSSSNGHKWGGGPGSGDVNYYGNNKTMDTWTFTYAETELEVQFGDCITISGALWNDANASNTQNGGEPGISGTTSDGSGTITTGQALFVYLVDANGTVIGKSPVASDGTYLIEGVKRLADNLKLMISTADVPLGSVMTQPTLPDGWESVSENVHGSNTATQSQAGDGIINVTTGTTDISLQNFGIQQPPFAGNGEQESTNPGGTAQVSVDPSTFTNGDESSDNDGNVTSIRITDFPENATNIIVDGVTYTLDGGNGTTPWPTTGVTVPTDASGNPTVDISVDPDFDGGGVIEIPFVSIDNAGSESKVPGSAVIRFRSNISGNVFNDQNGLTDNTVNGVNITDALIGETLYAILVDDSGIVVDKTTVNPSTGTYDFYGVPNGTYSIVLSTNDAVIGTTEPNPLLPEGWVYTGEHLGATTGDDGLVDGSVHNIVVNNANVTDVNFGINRIPLADDKLYEVDSNVFTNGTPQSGFPVIPGFQGIPMSSTNLVEYYNSSNGSLSGSDPEDCEDAGSCNGNTGGTGATFTIVGINENTKLYYDFGGTTGVIEVTNNTTIPNFDVTRMVIYGEIGSGEAGDELGFTYTMTDKAGFVSSSVADYIIRTNSPLPVQLLSFTAMKKQNTSELKWATASEEKNRGFEVLRSGDGRTWETIGFVHSLATNGTSTQRLNYSMIDNRPAKGNNYYKLKQIDSNGRFGYSDIQRVYFSPEGSIAVYPNPFQHKVNVAGLNGTETIVIYDFTGKEVNRINVKNINEEIMMDRLNPGPYNFVFIASDGTTTTKRLVKVD